MKEITKKILLGLACYYFFGLMFVSTQPRPGETPQITYVYHGGLFLEKLAVRLHSVELRINRDEPTVPQDNFKCSITYKKLTDKPWKYSEVEYNFSEGQVTIGNLTPHEYYKFEPRCRHMDAVQYRGQAIEIGIPSVPEVKFVKMTEKILAYKLDFGENVPDGLRVYMDWKDPTSKYYGFLKCYPIRDFIEKSQDNVEFVTVDTTNGDIMCNTTYGLVDVSPIDSYRINLLDDSNNYDYKRLDNPTIEDFSTDKSPLEWKEEEKVKEEKEKVKEEKRKERLIANIEMNEDTKKSIKDSTVKLLDDRDLIVSSTLQEFNESPERSENPIEKDAVLKITDILSEKVADKNSQENQNTNIGE